MKYISLVFHLTEELSMVKLRKFENKMSKLKEKNRGKNQQNYILNLRNSEKQIIKSKILMKLKILI